jgi:hypothetical protein
MATEFIACTEAESHGLSLTVRRSSNHLTQSLVYPCTPSREAAAEFQKLLDHPGIVLNDPIGPMARLQLARALDASGDRAKSAAAYGDLLAIWKDADPHIQVVEEAKAEAAKLAV